MTASAPFTDTARNRHGLTPRPAQDVGPSFLHAAVASGGAAAAFSHERRHPVHPVHVPARSLSMSIGVLEPGASTSTHRHAYEAIMYVLIGRGHSIVEGSRFDWKAGDALYTAPWCWHEHFADPDCRVEYVTATNMPMLELLGQTVMREEADPSPR
ncbi:MAG TPA: cupin domain-containing protein [Kofleriaceae bacterium]|nr:cupin domain-containing protein [Kofleriaceae bacterium]